MRNEDSNFKKLIRAIRFLIYDEAFNFCCNAELLERETGREPALSKLPSALLHHCRSVSPSSSPGCPPLDTLNWIPVRCAALPWVFFLWVTEHRAVHACVHTSLCMKKLTFLQKKKKINKQKKNTKKKLTTQNDRCQQTNRHTYYVS